MKTVGWWTVGILMGALTVWMLALGWIQREHARQTRWIDSTATVHQVQLDQLARQRVAALQMAEQARIGREAAIDQADRDRARAARLVRTTAGLRARLDSATTAGDSLPLLVAVVAHQDSAIGKLGAEVRNVRAGLAAEISRSAQLRILAVVADSAGRVQAGRIADLEARLRVRPPDVPSGRWLGLLPVPSRPVVLVVGAIIGGVLARR